MTTQTDNIIFFDVIEVFGKFITDNVEDIKKDRVGNRWVFPTFSESDSNLPQATIEMGEPSYEPDSAGNYLLSESLANGNYRDIFYKLATVPIHIYVLTEKRSEIMVKRNGEELYLSNKPLNLYITELIKNALFSERGQLLSTFQKMDLQSISPAYEDSKSTWATDLLIEIEVKDCYAKEYQSGELIASYTLNKTLI